MEDGPGGGEVRIDGGGRRLPPNGESAEEELLTRRERRPRMLESLRRHLRGRIPDSSGLGMRGGSVDMSARPVPCSATFEGADVPANKSSPGFPPAPPPPLVEYDDE